MNIDADENCPLYMLAKFLWSYFCLFNFLSIMWYTYGALSVNIDLLGHKSFSLLRLHPTPTEKFY